MVVAMSALKAGQISVCRRLAVCLYLCVIMEYRNDVKWAANMQYFSFLAFLCLSASVSRSLINLLMCALAHTLRLLALAQAFAHCLGHFSPIACRTGLTQLTSTEALSLSLSVSYCLSVSSWSVSLHSLLCPLLGDETQELTNRKRPDRGVFSILISSEKTWLAWFITIGSVRH